MHDRIDRRTFVRTCLGTVAAVSAAQLGVHRTAFAEDLPMVDPADKQAAALGYVEAAADADTEKFPRYEEGQNCANCSLYTGDASAESGPCNLFPGKAVTAEGWCNAWIKKA